MIRLNTIDKMTEEFVKSLIEKHMHFTWHNKEDNTFETMPGKVISCKDNKITVDTMDIFMLDDDASNENSKMIRTFNIDDITDIFPFEDDEYNPDVLDMVKDSVNGDFGYWQVTTPKTKSSRRQVPIPDVLLEDLKKLKEECEKYYGFEDGWFVFGDISPIHPHTLALRKNANAIKAGVKQIRIHDFRHSCCSLLINNGANITMVAKYLGHTKVDETLNTYSHMFHNKLDDLVNTINELNANNINKHN